MNFQDFRAPVATQFAHMLNSTLFRVEVDKDLMWETYLSAFPSGTNLVFRERREYDCSACRHFIRAIGDVVVITPDGRLLTIWDRPCEEPAYEAVSRAMAALIKNRPIFNRFLHTESNVGVDKNFEQLIDGVTTWNHFHVRLPPSVVCRGVDIGPRLSEYRGAHDVLLRSLKELTTEACTTILDLIAQNSLYRGEEHKATVQSFFKLKQQFASLLGRGASEREQDNWAWAQLEAVPGSVSKIRNTSIGTLLIDLSADMELEDAVRKYEAVVAPANYKRPTALVSKRQIEQAKQKLIELGLISALERRYARLEDISVNDILFVDRSARKVLRGGSEDVFDSLATKKSTKNLDRVEEVSIDLFIREIIPRAETIELMVENRHASNLVSLVAPVDPTAGRLFKWPNNFSWSYNGDVADSIKERVKKAGGNVTGEILCRLAWYNYDDLDLHMVEPSGYEIYFGNRARTSPSGGRLDVDMNAGGPHTREPVENIFYAKCSTMHEGRYLLFVHQFSRRETTDLGFEVEFEFPGGSHRFGFEKAVQGQVNVVIFHYTRASGVKIVESLPSSTVSKLLWGIPTQEFRRVNVACLSPNYWSDCVVGNKHYFFMLDGCVNDGTARGFYNEFLAEALTPYRKVIEMVGSKMRTAESDQQLSGIGFSSTQRNDILARVKGAFTRTVRIVF